MDIQSLFLKGLHLLLLVYILSFTLSMYYLDTICVRIIL